MTGDGGEEVASAVEVNGKLSAERIAAQCTDISQAQILHKLTLPDSSKTDDGILYFQCLDELLNLRFVCRKLGLFEGA